MGSAKHSREPSSNNTTNRVHSTANNVTYVAVGEDSNAPESPTPDYDDTETPSFEAALRSQYAAQATPANYQPAGQYRQR
jgi:hypothetical protein